MLDNGLHHQHQFFLPTSQNGDKPIGFVVKVFHTFILFLPGFYLFRHFFIQHQFRNAIGHTHIDFALFHRDFKFRNNLIASHLIGTRRITASRLGIEPMQIFFKQAQLLGGDIHFGANLVEMCQSQIFKIVADKHCQLFILRRAGLLMHLNQQAFLEGAPANARRVERLHHFQHTLHIFALHLQIGIKSEVVGNACT